MEFDFGGGFVNLQLAARGGDNISAGVGKAEREGAADAGGAAGYYCEFAFKTKKLRGHKFPPFQRRLRCAQRPNPGLAMKNMSSPSTWL